jgi:hypothetical protein
MDALTFKKKALKALSGMYDVLTGAGDPFLASMIFKATECVAKQPTEEVDAEPITDDQFWKAVLLLEIEYKAAQKQTHISRPLAYALYQVWKKADTRKL